jgi:NitT/TauT family transport system ATP-binding protein
MSASGPPIVALRDVGKTFANGTQALDGLDLEVRPGEFLTLLGPSGCGKSTALRLIAGLSEPSRGTIAWGNEASAGGHDIGFVFQEPTLMPWASSHCAASGLRRPGRVSPRRSIASAWHHSGTLIRASSPGA